MEEYVILNLPEDKITNHSPAPHAAEYGMKKQNTYKEGLCMKKVLYFICCTALAIFTLAGCGKETSTDSSALAGVWNGCGNAIGKDGKYRAENLSLTIGDEGSFLLSDMEQSISIIDGTFSFSGKNGLSLKQDEKSAAKLPKGWEKLSEKDKLLYEMPDKDHLILTYNSVSYYFEQEEIISAQMIEGSISPLLDIAETDIWYTNDDVTGSGIYELALYDRYAELYLLPSDSSEKGTFLTNFLYYDNEGENFNFYTCRQADTSLPDIFSGLPEGISQVSMKLSVSDEALHLEYDGKTLSFHNNVVYGKNTSSTAYFLNNTCFYWPFDNANHFCYFATEPKSRSLYLYISDGTEGQTDANVICGKITVDEGSKKLIFTFDKKMSKQTADKDSELFQSFKALEEGGGVIRIPFSLDGTRLKFKTKKLFGKTYIFDLVDYKQ